MTADHIMTKCSTLDEVSAFLSQGTQRIVIFPFFLFLFWTRIVTTSRQVSKEILAATFAEATAQALLDPSRRQYFSLATKKHNSFIDFIVDLPIKDCDFPVCYVSLQEGKPSEIKLNGSWFPYLNSPESFFCGSMEREKLEKPIEFFWENT